MGIHMGFVQTLERYGLLGAGRNLLDLGSSNLYAATAEEIVDFVRSHNPSPRSDLENWAVRLAAGSQNDATGSALNQSFVGEMLEEAGMGYDALDIAAGYKTRIVDLNTSRLPDDMVGKYDSVINLGTSEHILNQMNVFATLHAATKISGLMLHSVPHIGALDHGYFCYTSRFFFDLAGYNEYELVDMWFEGPLQDENIFTTARQYTAYFPILLERLGMVGKEYQETAINKIQVPRVLIKLIYRKIKDVPFRGTVETSTSIGELSKEVIRSYNG